jgi:hypothetical protein
MQGTRFVRANLFVTAVVAALLLMPRPIGPVAGDAHIQGEHAATIYLSPFDDETVEALAVVKAGPGDRIRLCALGIGLGCGQRPPAGRDCRRRRSASETVLC